jgi:hypothetical protein
MSAGHAFCSPSDWEGWSNCPGKPALEENEPEQESEYSAEGTLAHELAVKLLSGQNVELPPDLADGIRLYVAAVQARVETHKLAGAMRVQLLVEQKLDISMITTEKNAKGTADAVILADYATYSVLDVWDLKFGVGVEVEVENNGQLQIYGLAALLKYELLHTFNEVNLVIHQPRVRETPSEWRRTPDELYAFGSKVTEAAVLALTLRGDTAALSHLNPGDAQCKFCKVKYRCPALAKKVSDEVFGEFQDLTQEDATPLSAADRLDKPENLPVLLSRFMKHIPLIESWCLAVRGQVESELIAGHEIPEFKLVQGRRGARNWTDEDAVAKLLIADNRSPELIFAPRKLKTPTQLEKPLKLAPIWQTLSKLTKQSEGRPSVAPADDPRPAYSPLVQTLSDFDSYDGSDLV